MKPKRTIAAGALALVAVAGVGVCYVPQERWVEVEFGAARGSKAGPR